jgi:sortase (surface protein transpeptidase)
MTDPMSGSPDTRLVRRLERHLFSAILTGVGVVLLAGGLFAYVMPLGAVGGNVASASPGTSIPGGTYAFASPAPAASAPESPSPVASAAVTPGASASAAVATRIVIPALKIDLPVMAGTAKFPLCNVAQYLVDPTLGLTQPGLGTAYIYSHARTGMFLPLLDASQVDNGAAMIGYSVLVYTSDSQVYWYSMARVQRHVAYTDWTLVTESKPGTRQLVLQTSETPYATGTKLQILATFELVQPATYAESHPTPHPVVCS